ncbi:MAG: glucosidase [Candidatus Tectomicrobia bacterium]|uniref:Glucosidase n=1 Tax=Tectimicrobiota bacterium TaxID=2528274 RepID=A0A932GNL9_UNCTE|nr:glucosidase [Candidatus Tectomicrobia bacterium]
MRPQETAEGRRLEEARERTAHWRRWGPYLAERQWGTVREDYSPNGTAWEYFPHDHARSRVYRWGEDGLLGISDNHQRLCFALALWNERDPILKERLFGLTGSQGNHGEDVKEYYFYLDSTPTHSYMKGLYKYPQAAFPYSELIAENARRSRCDPEFELLDTGVFDGNRYFDVFVEYAKASTDDLLIRITATNRGPDPAPLHLLPTLWFRNTWSWEPGSARPRLRRRDSGDGTVTVLVDHPGLGQTYEFRCEGSPALLFTENDTNFRRLYGIENGYPFVKDAFHDYLIHGKKAAVNPSQEGTKAACHYYLQVPPGREAVVRLRLWSQDAEGDLFGETFDRIFAARRQEAEEFYATVIPAPLSEDAKNVVRQALAGMLWSKQWYHYDMRRWLEGDTTQPPPPPQRQRGRNHDWKHLYNDDVLSMPDKWEYPWYAAWDLAFHTIALALVDPDYAKHQLVLLLREWYMHPNGQLPAYEWAFGDVNPPVHAWAAWRVFKIERRLRGQADYAFLERVFHKLLLNFTWWVNRKDAEGLNIFQGGFLGMDNIGVFDRSMPLPTGGHIDQSDGTAWMAMYCLNMLAIAMELADRDRAYEDVASKFFEHFVYIIYAMNNMAGEGIELWDDEDKFYYDVLHMPDGQHRRLRIRSMVGLVPLFAVETLEPQRVDRLPGFKRRMEWFIRNRADLRPYIHETRGEDGSIRRLLAVVHQTRLRGILRHMLDEAELLSPYGIRALSRFHRDHPFVMQVNGVDHRVEYEPAESCSGLFGGNSNWRGPVWFPVNFLLIEALQKFHHYFGDDFQVEYPTGSGVMVNLWEIAADLSRRLSRIFLKGADGNRPVWGSAKKFQTDPHWKDLILFYEYFHGDNGAGIGAGHQTGWTGLVAKLLQQSGE